MPEDTRPRQTLAMRMAEQSRLRAERLARLVPAGTGRSEAAGPATDTPPGTTSRDRDASAALEEFLRSLTQGLNGLPPRAAPPAAAQPAEVLRFQRSPAATEAAPCDLERLEGVGPGLVWALRRAGVPDSRGARGARCRGARRPAWPHRPAGAGPGLDRGGARRDRA